MADVKKVYGTVDDVTMKSVSTGNLWKFKIDGITYNWFTDTNPGIQKDDYVEGEFYEKPNPNGSYPYKNINSLEKKTQPENYVRETQPETKPQSTFQKQNDDGYNFGMAVNGTCVLLAGIVECSHDKDQAQETLKELIKGDLYDNIVEVLYHKNKALKQKLIGDN